MLQLRARFTALAGICLMIAAGLIASVDPADARGVRVGAKVNVNKSVRVGANVNVRAPVYRSTNVNVDVNRGYPVARGVAVGTAAAVTAAAIGSMVYSLPSGCSHQKINGVWYYRCGDIWYEQRYSGSQVSYVVVSPPR